MTLTKEKIVDRIEAVGAYFIIQVRTCERILEDEQVISENFHRKVLLPGSDLSNEDSKIQAVASSLWTPDVIAAYRVSASIPETHAYHSRP